ncbi:UNVERIFIED_CONTAM: hypothetical protein PYX00_001670 [Menopon gallinae]|uniref:UDENN domain-containing protein n=1 Tax=Menopon gallinae TaxID=328185 RepID=A0AAW2IF17_9NEOP
MGSRIRNDVDRLYLCFCVIAQPESPDQEAKILDSFPKEFEDEQVLNSVPKFAFPCEFEISNIQHFSFVLTEANSKWTFGFCRHDPKTETALVFLSYLPWFEIFVKVLNCVAELIKTSNPEELSNFLYFLYESRVPSPGATLAISYDNNKSTLVLETLPQFRLPTIPQNKNLTEYYNAIDVNNMLVIFASMLYERRIIFKSKRLLRLSACVQAANAIIYPMHWQHIFIPVLPKHLVDYLLAPMPFLIGVPTSIWENMGKSDLGDIVVLDADTNSLETPFNDVESLPHDVVKFLKTQLKNKSTLIGDGLARIFLKALVQLIGGYRDALKFQQGQRITFSEDAFVQSRPSSMQPFLKDVLHLQIFQQFIEERLDLLNTGMGFSDEFEREACSYIGKSSSKQYKEYLSTMRNQGSAFLKTVKNKANPAVKSAVKSVREKGKDVKTAYKGIRSKMKRESTLFYEHSSKMGPPQPRSAPSSPTSNHISRFNQKPVSSTTTYKKQIISLAPSKRSNEYAPLKPPCDDLLSSTSEPDSASKSDALPHLNMNLMEDLQEVINRQFSLADNSDNSSPPTFRNLKVTGSVGDLIRLDAVPREDSFDPLDSNGTSSSSNSSNDSIPFKTGLTNPLYPYYTLNGRDSNTDNNFINSTVNTNSSFLHNTNSTVPPRCNDQDLDLLKEYDLDFTSNTSKSQSAAVNTSKDPFDLAFDNSRVISKKDMQNNWATFD